MKAFPQALWRRVGSLVVSLLAFSVQAQTLPSSSFPFTFDKSLQINPQPRIAVYGPSKKDMLGRDKALLELVVGRLEGEMSNQAQVKLLSRAQLEPLLNEKALSQKGITEARGWGEYLAADYVLSVSPIVLGKSLTVRVSLLNVLTGEIVLSKSRDLSLSSNIPQAKEVELLCNGWGRELSQYVPRQGQLQSGAGVNWTVNLGRIQGMRWGDRGRLERRDTVLGNLIVRQVDDLSSTVTVTLSSGVLPQPGDRVRFGILEAIALEQRGLWQAGVQQGFEFKLNSAEGGPVQAGDSVRVGEHLSLELTAPVQGYPIVVSAFPQDSESYLLYPDFLTSVPQQLKKGQHWIYPPSDSPVRWVALEPTGVTLFKVFILPQPLSELVFTRSGKLNPQTLQLLLGGIQAATKTGYQAEMIFEVVP